MNSKATRTGRDRRHLNRISITSALVAFALVAGMLPAFAASISSAVFNGGTGTALVNGTFFAKSGAALTLTVNSGNNTRCVQLSGAHQAIQTSPTAKAVWTFNLQAAAGGGVQTVNIGAGEGDNGNSNNLSCTTRVASSTASYTLDNTGPVVTGTLSPQPNAAGWNRANVTINWSATDGGSGVSGSVTPATDSVATDTPGTSKSASATDRVGNNGLGSVIVRLDKTAPTISASRSPAANSFGWNNGDVTVSFVCSDALAGIKSCPGAATLSSNGADQSATGTAADNADNGASATVSGINIDKVAPTLSGAPSTSPNAAGWYRGDVTIDWTASDGLSGIDPATDPANSTIAGEGSGLTAAASVRDRAGNLTSAVSSPAVKIDRTAPNTTTSTPADWTNSSTVPLSAGDNLSGVKSTHYRVDGGDPQTGTTIALESDGIHVVEFWSEDHAGNVEAAKTIEVKVDRTAPTITHQLAPVPSGAGWNNSDVTVTFLCGDEVSGVAECTAPQSIMTEGKEQIVSGIARDRAGNTASDSAVVSIDKSRPTISGEPDREPNAHGWYNDDVTVTFACDDQLSLSGILFCPLAEILGEGRNRSASGTAEDNAGNKSTVSLEGIDIDKTAPTLSGSPVSPPNDNGWYREDVDIVWSCDDALSGIDGDCPATESITGEGENLSASASVHDLAGNERSRTVDQINIDRNAPATHADVAAPLESGWYPGNVAVILEGVDHLSGVEKTYYSVDDGEAQVYAGPFEHVLKGEHRIRFWSVDKAGNIENRDAPGHVLTLKIDGINPTIEGTRLPAANPFGWNNGDVTVSFYCSDEESGLADDCPSPTTLSKEGVDQSVSGSIRDNAANESSTSVADINIDLTAPSLVGQATTDPNEAGWYRGDVVIRWIAEDALSGVDPTSVPDVSMIKGEGANLGAGPVTVADKAGNQATAAKNGIKIDRTAPEISGDVVYEDGSRRDPNAAGWYGSAVRVRFTCSDALSGVKSCAGDSILLGDGADQSVSGDAVDVADNHNSHVVSHINIDSQAPQTSASLSCTSGNGWCRGDSATLELSASDQAGLSGVEAIHYSIDGGYEQVVESAGATVPVPLSVASGKATVSYYAVDRAGNKEVEKSSEIRYDNIAPVLTHEVSPKPNAAGWHHSDATVHFVASDDDGGSGLDLVTPDATVSDETSGRLVAGSAIDKAGNITTDSVEVKLDRTVPVIAGAALEQANANGWYREPVSVRFQCTDELSGIAACTQDVTLSLDGRDQFADGEALDLAGNTASAHVTSIDIDTVAPETDAALPAALESGWYAQTVKVTLDAQDSLSGVDHTYYRIDDGEPRLYSEPFEVGGAGKHDVAFWSVDKAGNVEDSERAANHISVWVDDVLPTIAGGRTPANSFGWNNSPVKVHFECDDVHSRIAGCSPDVDFVNEGSGQSTTGSAVDNAGNTASATVADINIDLTKPNLEGVPTEPGNAAGWYNDDVTINWLAQDGLSGIDPSTLPVDSVVSGEGSDLGAGPVTVADRAGNQQSASIHHIKIDRTKPSISGGPTAEPNSAGWYRSAVTVHFVCEDLLSGVASCPSDKVVAEDGADQQLSSDAAVDRADNVNAGTSVGGINIDSKAPTTLADNRCAKVNDWCTGASATVVLSATDQPGLSGVKEIHYVVNGGEEQVAAGDSTSINVSLDGSGEAVVRYWAVDRAGNVERTNTVALRYDNIAPTVSHTITPESNAAGWNHDDLTVHFVATDNEGGSGIDSGRITPDVAVHDETGGRVIEGEAFDVAGNRGFESVTVRLDKTAPTINGAATTTPNANGWYRGEVTVHFSCADGLSGVAVCPEDYRFSGNGANQSVTASAIDRAGNRAGVNFTGINIDRVAPTLTVAGVESGAIYTLGAVPPASCTANDELSGLAGSCSVTVTGGTVNGVGSFNFNATATDKAGNTSTTSGSYTVIYRFDGFLQPINDTAHQVGTSTSVFKAGSTVPAKLQLRKANGTPVQANVLPQWLTPIKGGSMAVPVDEAAYSTTVTTGGTYRWDATEQQYIYNWGTAKNQANSYWRVAVSLDDGQTYFVNIGLR